MKVEAGKYYITRAGQVVGPMLADAASGFRVGHSVPDCEMPSTKYGGMWDAQGRAEFFAPAGESADDFDYDLVQEVTIAWL